MSGLKNLKRNKMEETLEEYIERNTQGIIEPGVRACAKSYLIYGANWQAERMYSEEQVIKIVEKSRETGLTAEFLLLTEQFKKK
jgi:hypothetical protein